MFAAAKNIFPKERGKHIGVVEMFAFRKIMLNLKFSVKGFLLLLLAVVAAHAQEDKPASREITSLDFQARRSKINSVKVNASKTVYSVKRRKKIDVVTNAKRRYNLVKRVTAAKPKILGSTKETPNKPGLPTEQSLKEEELGITFWRMRPLAEDEEDAPTFPVTINNAVENWTAERVASTTKFQRGDRVRFTVESSRSGYLYIVNREVYADGTKGDAEIIFPTLRTRGGDNRVTAGSLIEIPSSIDSVPFFTVKPRREDYAGEELFVVIMPNKLSGYEPLLRAQKMPSEDLQKWLDDWGTTVDIYDAADGEGVAYTKTESDAAIGGSRSLTREEPLPQTIYRVRVRRNMPLLVPFQLQAKP